MTTNIDEVTPRALMVARSALRRGYTLKEAAIRSGVHTPALDLALWRYMEVRLPDVEEDRRR